MAPSPTMRRGRLLLPALCALLPAAGGAAESEPAWDVVRADAVRAHVEFLADDLLEGRSAGSRGFDTAAAYVAAQFRSYGLRPAAAGGRYLQEVPLLEATAVLPGSSAELTRDDETLSFEYGADYLPGVDYVSPASTLTAPLVFAGFGVSAPELGYDDLAGIDVDGRIVVLFGGAPARFPHDQRAYYSWTTQKYSNLARRGAVGVITLDTREDVVRNPWDRRLQSSWVPQMRWLDQEGRAMDAFPELKLRFRFNSTAAARLFAGAPATFEAALDAAEAGTPQGFELPGTMTLSATTGLRRTQSANVVGVLEGSDPALSSEYIVVSAHLDHLGRGAPVGEDNIYNGAHDNASGIAILLEMARSLSEGAVRPKRPILFAAVTAEERGLLGSDFLAHYPAVPAGGTLVANLNIDMPMIFAPSVDFVAFGTEHSSLGEQMERAARAQGYRLSPDDLPEEVLFIRSDQFSFIRRGIPSLYLGGGYTARTRGTDLKALRADFLRRHYHEPSDDLAVPLDFPTAADLARVGTRFLLDVGSTPKPPAWNSGDFFAGKFPRTPAP